MPRPVIFDLDGVLADSEPLYEEAFRSYVTAVGRPEASEWFERTLGRRPADFAAELGRELGQPPPQVVAGLSRELERVLDRGGPGPMPFAADSVRRLAAGERSLGLASSSARRFIGRVVRALGLSGRFEAVAAGDEARHGKPHPELYLTAAERLGVAPATCFAIEDTPTGVASAVAAGMTTIAVPNALTADLDFSAAHAVERDLERATASILRLDDDMTAGGERSLGRVADSEPS